MKSDGQPTVLPPQAVAVADDGVTATITIRWARAAPSPWPSPATCTSPTSSPALLDHPRAVRWDRSPRPSPGPTSTMVNLKMAITEAASPDAKELEVAGQRFHYRTSPAALDVLGAAGVDVVTMANNHGADYGSVGMRHPARDPTSPIPVVGVGRDRRAAFTPYRVSVRGTSLAFLAADAFQREDTSSVWAGGTDTPVSRLPTLGAGHVPSSRR